VRKMRKKLNNRPEDQTKKEKKRARKTVGRGSRVTDIGGKWVFVVLLIFLGGSLTITKVPSKDLRQNKEKAFYREEEK